MEVVFPWMPGVLLFYIGLGIFNQYINFRQLRRYLFPEKFPAVPQRLQNVISTEDIQKSHRYNADKLQFSMMCDGADLVYEVLHYLCFLYPTFWDMAGRMGGKNEYSRSLAFFFIATVFSTLEKIPCSLYGDFVIEERHGFNKKTIRLFITDELKSFVLTILIASPIICAIIGMVRWFEDSFFVWLWIFFIVLSFLMIIIWPNFIAPLFNKFERLHDDALREKIYELAEKVNFPLTKLFQVDGSTRSAHSNAYFFGLWKYKRIVLYDTLLEQSHEEILSILGHELGHWKLWHTHIAIAASLVSQLGFLWLFQKAFSSLSLYESFGFYGEEGRAVVIGLLLFSSVYSPINTILGLCMNLLSRRNEFQADSFAVELNYGRLLQSALTNLFRKNLGCLSPDPLYAFYHFSHPPLVERLKALDDCLEKVESSKKEK